MAKAKIILNSVLSDEEFVDLEVAFAMEECNNYELSTEDGIILVDEDELSIATAVLEENYIEFTVE